MTQILVSRKNIRRLAEGQTQLIVVPTTTRKGHQPIVFRCNKNNATKRIHVLVMSTGLEAGVRKALVQKI
jgi:hypothetical protein